MSNRILVVIFLLIAKTLPVHGEEKGVPSLMKVPRRIHEERKKAEQRQRPPLFDFSLQGGTNFLALGSTTNEDSAYLIRPKASWNFGVFAAEGRITTGLLAYPEGTPAESSGALIEGGAGLKWAPLNFGGIVRGAFGLTADLSRTDETVEIHQPGIDTRYEVSRLNVKPGLQTDVILRLVDKFLGDDSLDLNAVLSGDIQAAIPLRARHEGFDSKGKYLDRTYSHRDLTVMGPLSGVKVGVMLGVGISWDPAASKKGKPTSAGRTPH